VSVLSFYLVLTPLGIEFTKFCLFVFLLLEAFARLGKLLKMAGEFEFEKNQVELELN
jgi:hypothetical protein